MSKRSHKTPQKQPKNDRETISIKSPQFHQFLGKPSVAWHRKENGEIGLSLLFAGIRAVYK